MHIKGLVVCVFNDSTFIFYKLSINHVLIKYYIKY